MPVLDRAAIERALNGTRLTVEVADAIDSTSSELLRRAASMDIHKHLLVAELQSAGRGRRGRSWLALAGGSLSFSIGWRFEQPAARLGGLPLAVGVALARALDAAGFVGIELKWPNDLVHRWRKLGGILIEVSGDSLGPTLAVVGVGLNVRISAARRRQIGVPVTDLASISQATEVDRNAVLACMAAELAALLERYANEGFAAFRSGWRARDALRNRRVEVLVPDGGAITGVALGVDADGALIVRRGDQKLRFFNAEVSVRRAR
jgi:BirA family biotin operon repressor/biotin-[acetyl-CoA-carboxylase] ligase